MRIREYMVEYWRICKVTGKPRCITRKWFNYRHEIDHTAWPKSATHIRVYQLKMTASSLDAWDGIIENDDNQQQ